MFAKPLTSRLCTLFMGGLILLLMLDATACEEEKKPAPTPVPAVLAPLPSLSRAMPPEARPPLTDPAKKLPDAPKVALGKYLFFDKSLSGNREVSCATCHVPDRAWADGLQLSGGYPETLYFRNTQTILNSASHPILYWDGRFEGSDMQSLIRDHMTEAHFMNVDGALAVERLIQKPQYVELFKDAFGGESTFGRILQAVEAYVSTLNSAPGPYDRYQAGQVGALSAQAAKGLELFQGQAGCAQCHSGPLLSDGGFHNLGVPENKGIFQEPLRHITFRRFFRTLGVANYRTLRGDLGLYAMTKEEADRGKFRSPSLREVARTAPYMHNGVFKTLTEVVEFYNGGGGQDPHRDPALKPLYLSADEVNALAAFLESLSGELIKVEQPEVPDPQALVLGKGTVTAPARKPALPATVSNPPAIGPLPPVPVPADNPMSEAKVQLGRFLFFDPRMSGDGSTACGGCHVPADGWGEGGQVSRGYPGTSHWRNSQTIINSSYYHKLFWAGEATSLEVQANSAWTGPLAGNLDPIMAEERLNQVPEYLRRFKQAFGTPPNWLDALRAVAAYERTLVSRNVPFDKFMQGDKKALTPKAVQGMDLFQGKAGCIQCHNGPLFTDESLHNIGVPKNPLFQGEIDAQTAMRWQYRARGVAEEEYRAADRDLGLFYTTKQNEDKGKFRTPTLRYLCYTAPYMHNGLFKSLDEVVSFYNKGGEEDPNKSPLLKPLKLSKGEEAALVEFLKSLCGDEILEEEVEIPQYEVLP